MGYSSRNTLGIVAAAMAAFMGLCTPTHAQKTLRAVMHSDLKILDPIWTTAYIVRNHGYMVYDSCLPPTLMAKSSRRWSTSMSSRRIS
jgi:peptide/nickel transport system substrate-binding protein